MFDPKGSRVSASLLTIIDRAPRQLLRWVCLLAAVFALGGADLAGIALADGARGIILAFIATVYGLRGLEKIKGVA